ncbi:NUDIX hydrolase [Flaviflexus massiliensis]|uniref:NUDIX hydrolase n=1 Tax=Flaviflexus massiliensis TaxID=1522309 RepID=UPI0006D5319F|nr:NUDIX hydrolase [Flaviflexus massiliensis]
MSSKPDVVAAGAVVWRIHNRKLEVLLIHRPSYDDWSIPKGKLNNGEDIPVAAIREVEEETGVPIFLGQPLGNVTYRLGDGRKKTTHYWAAQPLSPNTKLFKVRPHVAPAKTTEVDRVEWVQADRAFDKLTRESDRDLLGKLVDQNNDDKLKTWTLIVVRHSRAMKRSAWKKGKGSEDTRPLTPAGEKMAKEMIPLLSAYGVTRLVSSPWERCVATLQPYRQAMGIEIETHDSLTEAAHEKKQRPVYRLIDELLRVNEAPVALCAHRPTLPTIVEAFKDRAPHSVMKQVPKEDPWLQTGEALIAHVSGRKGRKARIVALEKLRPSI